MVGHGTVNIHAGRGHVNRSRAVIGKTGQGVVLVGGGDGNNVIQIVIGWVEMRSAVIIVSAVTGRDDDQDAQRPGSSDRVIKSLAISCSAQAHVDDVRAVLRGVCNGSGDVRGATATIRAEDPQRHDLDIPVNTDHPGSVVADRADRTGDMRAVVVKILGRAIAIHKIVSGHQVTGQVGMIDSDASIQHRYYYRGTAGA